MTEKERQEIIELVHKTLRGFFEPFPEGELGARPFTQTEKVLLEVNKAICEKIKEMPTVEQPQWIPCSERLPEEDGKYLVTMNGYVSKKPIVGTSIFVTSTKEWYPNCIAWMPLPDTYREKVKRSDSKL